MGKHDRNEWSPNGYYENRIRNLSEQLQNAQNKCERLTNYADKLERELAALEEKYEKLKDAYIESVTR